jgi:ATP-binding cassette subfamily F protein 3
VLSRLDLRLDPDERVALIGANGNGKTTLARLLAGRLTPFAGEITRSPKLACGFFAQHQIEEMRPEASAYDHLAGMMPDTLPEAVRTRLGSFGFGQEKAFVPVADLSGGERARLNLALITHAAPALLILDEPTNHLDIESREVLVEAINEFPGAVVLVSHDEHLIELIADRLWLVAGGTVRPFEGDLADYRRLVLERGEAPEGGASNGANTRKEARRLAAERRRELDPLRRQARRAEQEVARLTRERDALDRVLASGKGNGLSPGEALKRRAELVRQIERAETDWLAAAEAIEREARPLPFPPPHAGEG